MKVYALVLVLIAWGFVGTAQARLVDEARELRLELTDAAQTQTVYRYLSLPTQWGSEVTGKPHQYKSFTDKTGAVMIYTDLISNKPRIIVAIRKIESTNMVEVSHEADQSRVSLYDQDDARKLFSALLVKEINHGGYVMRALANDAMDFSVSCMKEGPGEGDVSCQVLIFKSGL